MADESEVVEAPLDPTDIVITAEDVAENVAAEAASEIESTAAEEAQEVEENPLSKPSKADTERKVSVKTMLERVGAKEALRQQEAEARAAAEAERDNYRAMLDRLQGGEKPPAPEAKPDIDSLVLARAEELKINEDRNRIVSVGRGKFGSEFFDEAAGIAAACGCVSTDFVKDVLAVDRDNAAAIYVELAKSPDRAIEIANMDSRRRMVELTRMSDKMAAEAAKPSTPAPKPAPVSKVPAPRPVVEASRSVEETPEDEMTDAQWSAWRKKQQKTA